MREKAKQHARVFDSKTTPELKNKNSDCDNENNDLTGFRAKQQIDVIRERDLLFCSDGKPTQKDVRKASESLSVSRLKLDRATRRYTKKLNGAAPQDKAEIMLLALAVEAFGPIPEGPDLVRELIAINRKE